MEERAEVADSFLELLNSEGVNYIFLNPGTDILPVQESLSKFQALGKKTPGVIMCPHESVAMAAAHGYFMVSQRPQVVMVHADVGTQNIGCHLHNAQRGRAGVVLCAGSAPSTFGGEVRGGRHIWVHWVQEQFDQAGLVRNYVKWEYELRRAESIQQVVHRAFQMAASEPSGPVYLVLPPELLRESLSSSQSFTTQGFSLPASLQAPQATLDQAAEWLLQSRFPLLLTSYAGRHPETVPSLVEFAELLAVPVIESRQYVNFPSDHELHLGCEPFLEPYRYLEKADLLLIVDCDVPWLPGRYQPSPETRIIHIDIDPIKATFPLWCFPAHLRIQANSALAIPALHQEVARRLSKANIQGIEERRQWVKTEHQNLQEKWAQDVTQPAGSQPVSTSWLAYCLKEFIDDNTIVVTDGNMTAQVPLGCYVVSRPGGFLSSGGSGLGWALGASLGVKLAAPEKTVLCIVGDGSFMYSSPISALWAAGHHEAPFLTIVVNNQGYNLIKRRLAQSYPEGYSVKTGNFIGCDFSDPPDYSFVAQACHAYGERVDRPGEVSAALARALEQVKGGKPAVLDVVIG